MIFLKKIFLLILGTLISTGVFSQDKVFVVELNPSKQIKGFGISCVEVIDKREDKISLGKVFKGITNKIVNANFMEDFMKYLHIRLHSILKKEVDDVDLVFIIHEMKITEQKSETEKVGYCKVEIEFARRIDTSLFSLGIFDSEIWESAISVNGTHGRRIVKTIKDCLKSLDETNWRNRKGDLIDLNAPMYHLDSIPKRGVYLSYGQMARSRPLIDVEFTMDALNPSFKYSKYSCHTGQHGLQMRIKYVSDGSAIFINIGQVLGASKFIKSKHFGRFVYFETRQTDPMAVSLLGLTGAIISNKPTAFILDTETNELKPFDKYALHSLTKGKYPEILREFKKSRRKIADLEKALLKLNKKYE